MFLDKTHCYECKKKFDQNLSKIDYQQLSDIDDQIELRLFPLCQECGSKRLAENAAKRHHEDMRIETLKAMHKSFTLNSKRIR